ncbi:hypothetical protein CO038_00990 [Candidatus Pacearchaeota archaeon CG_4_9_14_0_2_um_filter_39_13]|nr:hypothetical protein [Candidatus Pacearchaeota archaeon]OIO43103.1 MAG: hypothetical protein AUJ64_02885 [Candidatus Pacearchaeota archaeon CG1_02_39_14]PJC44951.1 MAG: hypothetical protein CO038_00990 [Candidatus Pacearchaeota archaeon CG_4_9_14_0_2_um_filter_39_13]
MIKKGQISVEYLVVVGFVTFLVIGVLGVAVYYSAQLRDSIKFYQLENYAEKIVSGAESVFYSGEPSRVTITAYLPAGVQSVEIIEDQIVVSISTANGVAKSAYKSNVPISGDLSENEGVKRIQIIALDNGVSVNEE